MKKHLVKLIASALAAFFALFAPAAFTKGFAFVKSADSYDQNDYQKLAAFLEITDANGVKNGAKLSGGYDVLDPESWGALSSGAPRFEWVESEGRLRIRSIRIQSEPGIPGTLQGELDLSGCSELYLLNCANNAITGLDVSGCSKLRFLECRWNYIPSLELSSCPELCVLICTDNCLRTLDLTANPLIPLDFLRMADGGLKYVSCYYAMDAEYSSESLFFISANCGEGCTTYHGWYGEDGRYLTSAIVFEPTPEMGRRFVARFTAPAQTPGDADGSGSVDLADALRIMRISMGMLPMQSGAGADVNGDGIVNMIDAMLVMRRSMGIY